MTKIPMSASMASKDSYLDTLLFIDNYVFSVGTYSSSENENEL